MYFPALAVALTIAASSPQVILLETAPLHVGETTTEAVLRRVLAALQGNGVRVQREEDRAAPLPCHSAEPECLSALRAGGADQALLVHLAWWRGIWKLNARLYDTTTAESLATFVEEALTQAELEQRIDLAIPRFAVAAIRGPPVAQAAEAPSEPRRWLVSLAVVPLLRAGVFAEVQRQVVGGFSVALATGLGPVPFPYGSTSLAFALTLRAYPFSQELVGFYLGAEAELALGRGATTAALAGYVAEFTDLLVLDVALGPKLNQYGQLLPGGRLHVGVHF